MSPTVVLTRAAEHNVALADRLAGLGIATVDVPMIEIRPPADGGMALEAAVAGLDLYHWLVVTSANGVRAVAAMLDRVGTEWPEHLKVGVVGPATAEAARVAGWPVDFIPETATALDLAKEFPLLEPDGGPIRVLAALAELGAGTVKKGLLEKGYQVDHVIAYRTVDPGPRDDPKEEAAIVDSVRSANAVAFTSPSTVTRFVDRFGVECVPPIVACIGPRSAKRATTLGLDVTVIATPHTEDGLVTALVDLLSSDRR